MPSYDPRPHICDYEGSDYRTAFWEGKGRDYEDRVERLALRRLLPPRGKRLLELGAGFGRLTEEYHGFDQVVLLDYSLSQLQYAQEHYGRDPRFVYVAADAYHLPFRSQAFDTATMIRVIHHFADVPSMLREARRVLAPGGSFILEHANKRNLKAMLRYALKRQRWSPYSLEPVEFVELNFDFHPEYMRKALEAVGFLVGQRIPVSFFRLGLFKKLMPLEALVKLDHMMQNSGLLLSPSLFVRCDVPLPTTPPPLPEVMFACPECGGELRREGDTMVCPKDGLRWAIRDGIYDFKATLD